ncbi:MAG TPA: helix-turn-helix domain-containing protein [Burkholderiaceae bacterium]
MDLPESTDPQRRTTCAGCAVRGRCLPSGLSRSELENAEQLVSTRLRVRRGAALYRRGDPFKSFYVVRLGSLKSTVASDDAREQVTGLHMAGEMVGFDGLETGSHACDIVALEDSEVCVFPFSRIEEITASLPGLRTHFYRMMSRELVHKHGLMLMLGSMRADERLATFLLDLSDRHQSRGYSSTEFVLRMSRAEIGSFLGITIETVSRVMSQFAKDGLIDLQGVKQVRIADVERLRQRAIGREAGKPSQRASTAEASRVIVSRPATRVARHCLVEQVRLGPCPA